MAKRQAYDWEAIEREYRAGMLSIREIATTHGCSDTAIRKRMRRLGVERDLTEKIAEKVRNELVRAEGCTANPQTEKDIVEHAAATKVEVVRSHRKDISAAAKTVKKLLKTLDDEAGKQDAGKDLQRNSAVAVNLTNSLKTLINLERQAFSLDEDNDKDKGQMVVTLSKDDMAL